MKPQKVKTSIVLITFLLGFTSCSLPTVTPSPTPFPSTRTIASQTLPLQEKWRLGGVWLFPGYWNRNIIRVIPTGLVFADQEQRLVLLDGRNGQVLWQTKYKGGGDSVVADEERVYLSSGWRISAYRLADGQLLWQTGEQETHRGYDLYLRDGLLFEYSGSRKEDRVDIFDPATGLKLDTEIHPLSGGKPSLALSLEKIDLYKDKYFVFAVERNMYRTLWQIPNNGRIATPATVGDLLIITMESDLLALRLYTGEILWQKSGVASNPAVMEGAVYVITMDGSLRAYDLTNGRELGNVTMDPPVTITSNYTYALVADEKNALIYAYYGDSRELIVFSK